MKFRTEINLTDSPIKIGLNDHLFSIGSCFSTEMSDLLKAGQLKTYNNPFGTLFNPFSINNAVKKLHDSKNYAEEDLVSYNDTFLSLDHHTSFNARFAHQTLDKINTNIELGNQFLRDTKWVIITYGTSYIYEFLPKKKYAANCHKIPAKYFEKKFLSHLELTDSIYETIINLKDICNHNVQILFTVSPVRHTKDGIVENSLSKSKLITAIHEILPQFENCFYLPSYEILMDDLRDYRFYKEDLIHPNNQAVQYIWEKFGNAYFSDETKSFITENFKIVKALEHKVADKKDPKYMEFLDKIKEKIVEQQSKVNHPIF